MEKKVTKAVLSHEEKLELMLEYMNKTGEKIKATTKYKGYNLGSIRNNLRGSYFRGTLKMEESLLKKFIEAGIINAEKERKNRTTHEDKYNFVMQFAGKSLEEIKNAKMETGLSFYEAKKYLQLEYNKGTLKLTPEQIENLIHAGILNYTREEQENIANECGIPVKFAIDIIKKYGSFENFLQGYKKGEIDYEFNDEIFCAYRGVALSEKDRTEREKLAYCMLAEAIMGISIGDKKTYIDIDKLEELLSTLEENEKKVIILCYGLEGKAKNAVEAGKELKVSAVRIGQIKSKAIRKLHLSKGLEPFFSDAKKEETELEASKNKFEEIQESIKDWKKVKEFIIDENGVPKEGLEDIPLSEIGVSERILPDGMISNRTIRDLINIDDLNRKVENQRLMKIPITELNLSIRVTNSLGQAQITNLAELMQLSKAELIKMKTIGIKGAREIIEALENKGITMIDEETAKVVNTETEETTNIVELLSACNHRLYDYLVEQKKIIGQIKMLENRLGRYHKGYENYIKIEDLFNPDAIVPATPEKQEKLSINEKEDSIRKQALLRSIEEKQKKLLNLRAKLIEIEAGKKS